MCKIHLLKAIGGNNGSQSSLELHQRPTETRIPPILVGHNLSSVVWRILLWFGNGRVGCVFRNNPAPVMEIHELDFEFVEVPESH